MFTRLRTVRAKLTALVALSIVVMLAALPILSWLLHRQMLDEVDDRVVDAKRSFLTEVNDDLADLDLAARVLGRDEVTRRGVAEHDSERAHRMADTFLAIYPSIDILLLDANGLVAQVGCTSPATSVATVGSDPLLAKGGFVGVLEHGCETGAAASPAMVRSVSLTGKDGSVPSGVAIACMPLDDDYVNNAAVKLGVDLALAHGDTRFAKSPDFPTGGVGKATEAVDIVDMGSKTWALASFDAPPLMVKSGAPIRVVDALEVSDVQSIIRKNLLLALLVLLIAASLSVTVGLRLAGMMSEALARVSIALKQLGGDRYPHVVAVKTGDELEDLAAGFNTMVDGLKERDDIKSKFDNYKTQLGKYMTAEVMARALSGEVQLGGETLRVTILFSDIRGFTTISEKMNAQELVGLLNEYFTAMVGIVMDSGGIVDKYIGDAIMVVFGAPLPHAQDPVNAVVAAVRMRQGLIALNEGLAARGLQPLRTGIGIHTGEVVAGNIGSDRRLEYTVIGDAVNLASRLESSTKELGVNVLISEDTWKLVKDAVVTRPVKEITVKGRHQPVMTYEVVGIVGEPLLTDSPVHQ
jgi:adenylate cyclase